MTPYIRVDQLGYLPAAPKVAVVADPVVGANAADSYTPGQGGGHYQVRRWVDDLVVWTGTLSSWNGGAVQVQSGDRGWWLDFSAVSTPGSYYVHDQATGQSSGRFEIASGVYNDILRQVQRTFYVQRLGKAHSAPYSDARWRDKAAFLGPDQDPTARDYRFPADASRAKDLRGGWMDAGDTNKYVTFAERAVLSLVEAYRANPGLFTDDLNIPESGNGIPDLLDELSWELAWLKRMQDATGTGGLLLKVGVNVYGGDVSPLSGDARPRFYVPECSSATLSGAAMFAAAGKVFRDRADSVAYGTGLINRAERAWNRAEVVTKNFTQFDLDCDDGSVKAGDADNTGSIQMLSALTAASYLYEATGKSSYRSFLDTYFATPQSPVALGWWGPYERRVQTALLRYANMATATLSVANQIKASKANQNATMSINDALAQTDLYRAHTTDDQYHWGHNIVRAEVGNINLDFVQWGINPGSVQAYKNLALEHLHWLHGVNPLGLLMFSHMAEFGAENSVRQIHHSWFQDGTAWDDALNSPKGPAPGYMTGGPNKVYTGNLAQVTDQPPQKAYVDTNTLSAGSNVWELSEPSITGQAAYLLLLARALLP